MSKAVAAFGSLAVWTAIINQNGADDLSQAGTQASGTSVPWQRPEPQHRHGHGHGHEWDDEPQLGVSIIPGAVTRSIQRAASHVASTSWFGGVAEPLEDAIEPPIAFPLGDEMLKWRIGSRAVRCKQLRRLLKPDKRHFGQPPVSTLRFG